MSDRLGAAVPPPPPQVHPVAETVDDLKRILALPRRPPVDCERDPETGRFSPATQALIEVVTERFSRGPRLSCACRPRKVLMAPDGGLVVTRVLPEGVASEPPLRTTVAAFAADSAANKADLGAARVVSMLHPGGEVALRAADGGAGHFCITMLNAVQAWILREASIVGGVVAMAGVGAGKTLAWLLAPLLFPDADKAVLLIEPKQRQHYKSQYLRVREHFRVSTIVHDDGDGDTIPGTPPLHLVSYSVLSRTSSTDLLDRHSPDILILDEAHRACGDSAIRRRVQRYVPKKLREREQAIARGEPVRRRAVYVLDGSGTFENWGIEDTQMLCAYSLGTGSPLPLDPVEAQVWSQVIDPSHNPDRRSKTAKALQRAFGGVVTDESSLDDLLAASPERAVRRGFCDRRRQTLGIISASASAINAAIYFSERKAPKFPDSVVAALAELRDDWKRPDGEVLFEKIEQVSCVRNVACGFYPYWAFPKHKCTCSPGQRCDQCLLIDDWYAKRKLFNKELRSKLQCGEVHLDSPQLCREAAQRHWQHPPYEGELPKWHSPAWPAWRDIEDKVEYDERTKWLDDFLARDAAVWAAENRGVVWFQSTAFGHRIAEIADLPYFNGGPNGEARLRAEKGDRSIVVSMKAHGAGTDGLQYLFCDQLIAEIPASNASQQGLEQVLGRLHREGQKSDVVNTWAYLHVPELRDAFDKAVEQAEFNFEMTKNRQKILMADLDLGFGSGAKRRGGRPK
jgi:hypothetical protein